MYVSLGSLAQVYYINLFSIVHSHLWWLGGKHVDWIWARKPVEQEQSHSEAVFDVKANVSCPRHYKDLVSGPQPATKAATTSWTVNYERDMSNY